MATISFFQQAFHRLIKNRCAHLILATSITGCGGGTEPPTFATNPPPNASNTDNSFTPINATTRILFDPASSILPSSVNDLIFLSPISTDGTATTTITDTSATPAVNSIDGFSTLGQVDFAFSGPLLDSSICTLYDLTLLSNGLSTTLPSRTAACATAGQPNVVLVPLTLTDNADPLDVTQITGVDTTLLAQTQYRAEVITLDCDSGDASCSQSVLRITPLAPLPAKTKFLVGITNGLLDDPNADGIHDTAGENASTSVGPSIPYDALGEPTNGIEDLGSVNDLILGLETVMLGLYSANNFSLSADQIVYTQTFTTTAPTETLKAIAAPSNFNSALPALGVTLPIPSARDNHFYQSKTLGPGQPGVLGAPGNGENGLFSAPAIISEGAISLPYYLSAPALDAAENDTDGSLGFMIQDLYWQASRTIGDALDAALGQPVGTTPPADIIPDISDEVAATGFTSGVSYNVTYRFPFPQDNGNEIVPITVMYPSLTSIQTAAAAYGDGSAAAQMLNTIDPADPNWPVAVFAIGITTDRSVSLLLANALAGACLSPTAAPGTKCFATVTIDHPVHGLAAEGALIPGVLDNVDRTELTLPEAFSNLRERHFGYTANASIRPIPMVYGDTPETSVGSSGSLAINLANLQNSRDKLRQSVVDHLNVLASLGSLDIDQDGNIPDLDTEQVYFIGHSLGGIIGVPTVAVNNDAAVQAANEALPIIKGAAFVNTSGNIGKLVENLPDTTFGASVILSGLALNSYDGTNYSARQGTSSLESFLYFFQNTMDSVDPINFANQLNTDTTAILLTEVIGSDDQSDPRDQTIPAAADDTLFSFPDNYANGVLTQPFMHQLAGFCPVPGAQAPGTCLTAEALGVYSGAPALPDGPALAAPFVGTEPLIQSIADSAVTTAGIAGETTSLTAPATADITTFDPLKVAVRFTDGEHGTLVAPINTETGTDHTSEFIEHATQIISFFSSEGTAIAVGTVDPTAIYSEDPLQ